MFLPRINPFHCLVFIIRLPLLTLSSLYDPDLASFTNEKVILDIHYTIVIPVLAHLHHYVQTDGFGADWFQESSRSLYEVRVSLVTFLEILCFSLKFEILVPKLILNGHPTSSHSTLPSSSEKYTARNAQNASIRLILHCPRTSNHQSYNL